MSRHPRQQLNYGRAFTKPHQQPKPAEPDTTSADAAALDKVLANKPSKPPHRHLYERGVCSVCKIKEPDCT